MRKYPEQDASSHCKNTGRRVTSKLAPIGVAPNFIEFWYMVACELGNSRLKINRRANSIKHVIDRNSDPKDYLKNAVQQSYKRSNCHHLKSPVDLNVVLDVLGETAFDLKGLQADDLLDIELLEEIAWLISERYWVNDDFDATGNKQSLVSRTKDDTATIICIKKTKIVQANSRL